MKSAGVSLFCMVAYSLAQQSPGVPYRDWVNEDVTYIITDQERSAFLQLQTDEERAQFIENFWLRRDPTPDTIENEFRDEHYRRIAYANEKVGSSMPGWKTDRGRVYITYGPPDEIHDHSSGSGPTYPFQQWRYRYIEGVGPDVNIEFDDPTKSGEFRMTIDPADKGPGLIPDPGLTILEQMGLSDKTQPFQGDGTHLAAPIVGIPEHVNEIKPVPQFLAPMKRPQTKFPDLKAKLYSRIIYFLWPMRTSVEFFPVTGATALTYVTVQFENKDLQWKNKDGVSSGNVQMFGEFTTLDGRVVESFEDDIQIDGGPTDLRAEWLERKSVVQKIVRLSPGTYRLELACKDAVGGGSNNFSQKITVPSFDAGTLSTSTLILADDIETVAMRNVRSSQFVIGDSKVRARIGGRFRRDETLGVYMQLYNLGKPQGQVAYEVLKAGTGEVVVTTIEDIAKIPDASGSQVTLQKLLPLKNLSPGSYTVRLTITDNNGKQTLSESAQLTVTSPVKLKGR